MPKIFNDKQREEMNRRILHEGRALFRKKGFLKTSVNEITDAVGIAKGTFYNFYDSKEALFMAVLGEFEKEKFTMIDQCFTHDGNPVKELESFLVLMYQSVAEEPIFQWLYQEKVFERIIKKIPSESLVEMVHHDVQAVEKIFACARPRGFLNSITADEMVQQLRGMFLMTLHRDEIGAPDFSMFMAKQISIFVNGLKALEGSKHD